MTSTNHTHIWISLAHVCVCACHSTPELCELSPRLFQQILFFIFKEEKEKDHLSLFQEREKINFNFLVWASGFEKKKKQKQKELRSKRPCAEIRRSTRGQKLSCLKGSWCAWTCSYLGSRSPGQPTSGAPMGKNKKINFWNKNRRHPPLLPYIIAEPNNIEFDGYKVFHLSHHILYVCVYIRTPLPLHPVPISIE